MRIFVTGASGHIGSALVPELLAAGHHVVGLARSDSSAAALEAAGVEVHRGDLDDLDALAHAASEADGVIHLAFKHEAMVSGDMMSAVAADQTALEVMGGALEGTGKALVATGGTLMLAMGGITGRPGTESDTFPGGPRIDAENYVIGLADKGVRSSYLRLPPLVHSHLDHHGFTPALIQIARESGVSGYPGEGTNRWPAGHTLDVAHLYRLAVEDAPAGSRFHGAGDDGIPFRDIAANIGRHLDLPVRSVTPDHFGFLEGFITLDNPVSTEQTRKVLDWAPTHPGLLADLDEGHYFGQS